MEICASLIISNVHDNTTKSKTHAKLKYGELFY